MPIKYTQEEFIAKAIEKYGDKYDYSKVNYINGKRKVTIICKKHGEFQQLPYNHLHHECRKCTAELNSAKNTKTQEKFIEDCKFIHGNRYNYSKTVYKGAVNDIIVICKKHGDFTTTAMLHLAGYNCMQCSIEDRTRTTEQFIEESRDIHGDYYDYSITQYKTIVDNVNIRCIKHGIFTQTANIHLSGGGCTQCGVDNAREKKSIGIEDFILRSKEIHGDKYDYSKSIYITRRIPLVIICTMHKKEFLQTPSSHLAGYGCKKCSKSRGEKFVMTILDELEIHYENEKKFPECKNIKQLRFDFYLPNEHLLIEFDGEQHSEPIEYFGGEEGLKQRQINDMIKNNYANNYNIPLLRINYNTTFNEIRTLIVSFIMNHA